MLSTVYIFWNLFINFFSHRVPSNLFQKLLLHILEKRKEFAWQLARLYIPGRLRSLHRNWRRLAVYQWWDSKRGTSNTSAWYIGLWKRDGVWIWVSAQQLNISKWRDSKPAGNDACAEISKNGGLFNSIACCNKNAYICEMPGGKITFQP